MRRIKRESPPPSDVSGWEIKIVEELSRQLGGAREREDLEAELLRRLAELRLMSRRGIRSWKDYLWISLRNHALNVLRRRPAWKEVSLDAIGRAREEGGAGMPAADLFPAREPDFDGQMAWESAFQEFNPNLRRLWAALEKTDGKHAPAARLLRVHRNTIPRWIAQMRLILERHGLA